MKACRVCEIQTPTVIVRIREDAAEQAVRLFYFGTQSRYICSGIFLFPTTRNNFSGVVVMTKSKAKTINSDNTAKTTKLAVTAMLAALSAVLMFFEFPLGFIAPSFYEFDFSEVPVLVGTFSMGPIAGAVIEFVKILVKFLIKGTSTGGVGELANFLIGCSFILPAGFIYKYKKTRVGAIVGMLTGTVAMAAIGVVLNTFVLVPLYSSFMPLTEIIKMGQAIFPAIDGTFTFCLYCVGPFNIIKGLIISVVVFIIYKPLSRLINSLDTLLTKKKKATVQ